MLNQALSFQPNKAPSAFVPAIAKEFFFFLMGNGIAVVLHHGLEHI
jgi:hypothetical protein